jgi:hypothetical protein
VKGRLLPWCPHPRCLRWPPWRPGRTHAAARSARPCSSQPLWPGLTCCQTPHWPGVPWKISEEQVGKEGGALMAMWTEL